MIDKSYTIMKGALLNVSEFVHSGIDIEDIEEVLDKELTKNKIVGLARPVPGMLAYDIRTIYTDDKDIIDLMDRIVDKLDILLVDTKEKVFFDKN